MIKKLLLLFALSGLTQLAFALNIEHIDPFFKAYQHQTSVIQANLPAPYDYLLTQPLMTEGLTTYYNSSPIIERLYVKKNQQNRTYHRLIRMVIRDKNRQKKVVELASISINFKALPKKVRYEVQNSNTPFGQLLLNNHIKIKTKNRSYFKISCNNILKALTHCSLNKSLYGRTNTIINADTEQWLARVIEILM